MALADAPLHELTMESSVDDVASEIVASVISMGVNFEIDKADLLCALTDLQAQTTTNATDEDTMIPMPKIRKMDAWKRQRSAPNPTDDNYVSLTTRTENNLWHEKHGRPTNSREFSEDSHFMMRCLYPRLPLDNIQVRTRSAKSVDSFTRCYGKKFGTFAVSKGAVEIVAGVERMSKHQCLTVLREWLHSKLDPANGNQPFGWIGFEMSVPAIHQATAEAYAAWEAGYV